jgi:hypothetical protein
MMPVSHPDPSISSFIAARNALSTTLAALSGGMFFSFRLPMRL